MIKEAIKNITIGRKTVSSGNVEKLDADVEKLDVTDPHDICYKKG